MYFSERQENTVSHFIIASSYKETEKRAEHPYLLSHRAVLKLDFIHNNPIHAAHPLSFRPISENTKQQFLECFDKGNYASSATPVFEA